MWYSAVGFIVTLTWSLLAAALAASAQPAGQIPRIGYLSILRPPGGPDAYLDAFREGLREHGWVEGQTIAIDYRWAEESPDRLPALAAELVRLRVDVIFASAAREVRAAKDATTTIPIVFRGVSDGPLEH